jgi:hypothetical protein
MEWVDRVEGKEGVMEVAALVEAVVVAARAVAKGGRLQQHLHSIAQNVERVTANPQRSSNCDDFRPAPPQTCPNYCAVRWAVPRARGGTPPTPKRTVHHGRSLSLWLRAAPPAGRAEPHDCDMPAQPRAISWVAGNPCEGHTEGRYARPAH